MPLTHRQKRRLLSLPIGLGLGILFCILNLAGLFETYELESLDIRYRIRGPRPLSDQISLVIVDNDSLRALGWPVPRGLYASLVGVAGKYGARVVGFDILFTDPGVGGPEGDRLFAEAARLEGNAVFPAELSISGGSGGGPIQGAYLESGLARQGLELAAAEATTALLPLPGLAASSSGMSHIQLDNRADGVFRGVPLFLGYGDRLYPALGLRLVLDFLGLELEHLAIRDEKLVFGDDGSLQIPVVGGEPTLPINYRSVTEGFRTQRLIDVLAAYRDVLQGREPSLDLAGFFEGKLVLVGQTAASVGDHGSTPLSTISPLVLAHANFIDNLLSGQYLSRAGPWVNLFVILLLCGAIAVAVGHLRMLPGAGVALLLLIGWAVVAHLLFSGLDYWIDLFAPMTAGVFVLLGATVYNHFVRDADERLYRQAFEKYVAPGMMDKILEDPKKLEISGQRKRMTILFSDLKGYTRLSQELLPSEILDLLREYLEVMTRILFEHGGTVDKIMGDGIMAFFGDPLDQPAHALQAVWAALEMQSDMNLLQRRWIHEGKTGLEIRIGIATGEVYVGNIGSSRHIEYTAIGHAVNLASRLESKAPPGSVLISQETYEEVKDSFDCEEVPGLDLKGFEESYKAYWVFGIKPEPPPRPAEEEVDGVMVPDLEPFDRRQSQRLELVTGVKFTCFGRTSFGRAVNISRDGMFIATGDPPPVGTDISVIGEVHANQELLPLWIHGKVRRVIPEGEEKGMGIQFERIMADNKETIRFFMRDVFGMPSFQDDTITVDSDEPDSELYRYEFTKLLEEDQQASPDGPDETEDGD